MSKERSMERLALSTAALYSLDQLLKFGAVSHFFRQPPPPPCPTWPSVAILSPITQGASNLPHALACRGRLRYAGMVQHLLICDQNDADAQQICQQWQIAHPDLASQLILVDSGKRAIAGKIDKLNAALPRTTGDILLFVDDDVALRPETLVTLVPYLADEQVGAVFGLACYTAWHNLPSSLMSAFVNSNALLSYIPLSYLTEPFTITGHCFAVRRDTFDAAGGFNGMAGRLDDDHELARRLRRVGRRVVQTRLIYDVENHFTSIAGYAAQMKRWFVFPQRMMVPQMTMGEQMVMWVGSLNQLLLPLLALLAFVSRRRTAVAAFGGALTLFGIINMLCERRYLQRRTPWSRRPLLIFSALTAPLHILHALVSRSEVTWRGQRLRVQKDGTTAYLDEPGG